MPKKPTKQQKAACFTHVCCERQIYSKAELKDFSLLTIITRVYFLLHCYRCLGDQR